MKLIVSAAIVMSLSAAACGKKTEPSPEPAKKEEPKKEDPKPADPTKAGEPENTVTKAGPNTNGEALGGEKVKLDKLKLGGTGFDATYNEALDSWTVEKWTPRADGGNDLALRMYVDGWHSDDWPTSGDDFAKKLGEKDFLDFGYTWQDQKVEAFDGGWTITGNAKDDEGLAVAFATRVDKLGVLCHGFVKNDVPEAKRVEVRDEAIAACKATTRP